MSFLFGRRRTGADREAAERLHDGLIAAIRKPDFYLSYGVPDTFEGRFDLLVLHASLVLHRLSSLGQAGEGIAQILVDTIFTRLDVAMRELGVSDIGVPKRMRRLAEAYKGRTAAYSQALAAHDESGLAVAVGRNILDGKGDGALLAAYAMATERALGSFDLAAFRKGLPVLPEPSPAIGLIQG